MITMKEQEINIAEILKDCPQGTKLYSPTFGDLFIEEVGTERIYTYKDSNNKEWIMFYPDGKYNLEGECSLFPSKDQRDWSKFKKPVKTIDEKAEEFASREYEVNREDYEALRKEDYEALRPKYYSAKEVAIQWRSADEELPEGNKQVLIKYRHGVTVGRHTLEEGWFSQGVFIEGSVYWMPIPEPPITREEIEFNANCDAYRAMRAGAKDEKDLKDRINAFRSGKRDW